MTISSMILLNIDLSDCDLEHLVTFLKINEYRGFILYSECVQKKKIYNFKINVWLQLYTIHKLIRSYCRNIDAYDCLYCKYVAWHVVINSEMFLSMAFAVNCKYNPREFRDIFAPGHEITSAKCIELYRCDVSPHKRRMCEFFNFDILAFYEELRIIANKCDNLLYICTDEANVLDEILFFVAWVTGLLSKRIICIHSPAQRVGIFELYIIVLQNLYRFI